MVGEEEHDNPGTPAFTVDCIVSVCCILIGGVMSGLTVGLLSIDEVELELAKVMGTP